MALPGVCIPDLSEIGNFNNIFSSEEINIAAPSATLFDDFDYWGDYFDLEGGEDEDDLGDVGFNDMASSLIVWWFLIS